MVKKNSQNSPLRIAEVPLATTEGMLGLTLCPGKKDASRQWNRDLTDDLTAIQAWGASTVVTLIEDHEFALLGVGELGQRVGELGMNWIHLPIVDVSIPDGRFEELWANISSHLHSRLDAGERILVHCRGGLGRTGLVAGRILVERGCDPDIAMQRIRAVRPGAIETEEQERYVLKSKPRGAVKMNASGLDMRSRVRGCLLGGAVGDALGAPVEFMTLSEIRERFGPAGIVEFAPSYGRLGTITDDTQMTLFTADGFLRAAVRGYSKGISSVPSVICHAYMRWLLTQGVAPANPKIRIGTDGWLWGEKILHSQRAPGSTCISVLTAKSGLNGNRAENDRKGAGAIMRVAPIACATHRDDESSVAALFELAKEASWITHGHPSGFLSAAAFAVILHAVLKGKTLSNGVQQAKALLQKELGSEETLASIEKALDCVQKRVEPEMAIPRLGEGWIGEEALSIALYCALISNDFASGVRMAVNHNGDSDTTGSMVGQLLGATYGEVAIPKRWMSHLEAREVIAKVADDLCDYPNWGTDDEMLMDASERYPGW